MIVKNHSLFSDFYIKLLGDMQQHTELRDACVAIKRGLAELQYASMKIEGFSPVRSADSEEHLGESASSVPIIESYLLHDGGGSSGGATSSFPLLEEGNLWSLSSDFEKYECHRAFGVL